MQLIYFSPSLQGVESWKTAPTRLELCHRRCVCFVGEEESRGTLPHGEESAMTSHVARTLEFSLNGLLAMPLESTMCLS